MKLFSIKVHSSSEYHSAALWYIQDAGQVFNGRPVVHDDQITVRATQISFIESFGRPAHDWLFTSN